MNYFDSHTHTNFFAYDADREAVIERAREAGVGFNVVGTQRDTSASAIVLAERYDGVYATIGLHPIHTDKSYHDEQELGPSFAKATKGKDGSGFTSRGEVFDRVAYEAMARHPKVIAIGECGLDYFRCDESTKKKQEEAFVQQIELANLVEKPLMLHIRPSDKKSTDAYDDALELIKSHAKVSGNAHFFVGSWQTAQKFLDLGFSFSFNGVLTFTHDYDEVVQSLPLDHILSETDAPYLAPIPFRGKRNEPMHVIEVVKAIARIRELPESEVAEQVMHNMMRVFGLSI